jgi:hypothetical protein
MSAEDALVEFLLAGEEIVREGSARGWDVRPITLALIHAEAMLKKLALERAPLR